MAGSDRTPLEEDFGYLFSLKVCISKNFSYVITYDSYTIAMFPINNYNYNISYIITITVFLHNYNNNVSYTIIITMFPT